MAGTEAKGFPGGLQLGGALWGLLGPRFSAAAAAWWVWTLQPKGPLRPLPALEGLLGGLWLGGPWPPRPASIHLSLLRQVAVCLPSPQV